MRAERWEEVQRIFHRALELDETERREFIRRAVGGDPDLEREILALLEIDETGRSPLDGGVEALAEAVLGGPAEVPKKIGPYRILELLGEGGMGVVYKARREDLNTVVAIKFLLDARLSPQRRERFLREERMLGRLHHPSVCALHDAGLLKDGTPYFVMEYVDGLPLTQYCERYACGLRERLRLFREVGDAVRHAHGRMLIHRDLKPSNILATRNSDDSGPTVKLLDFGIAKQTAVEGAEPATRTVMGMMTPAYAAPEQLRGKDLGTHTDVYSLGVVLYELLTGELPFSVADKSPLEAAEIMESKVPTPPSVTAKESHRAPSFVDSVPARDWADLDVLCLTAIHPDVERRYRSVDALVGDLDRFLSGNPLEARPDSARYRIRKFLRRHRKPVAAIALTGMAIAALLAFYTWQLSQARDQALAEAARTQRVQNFTLDLFQGGDELAGPRQGLDVSTLLERGVREAQALDSEPAIQAELFQTLGNVYRKMGHLELAEPLIRKALDARRSGVGMDHPDVAESIGTLGELLSEKGEMEQGELLARQALDIATRSLPKKHPRLAAAHEALGAVLIRRGRYDDAFVELEQALAVRESASSHRELMECLGQLANAHFYAGNYEQSDSINLRILEMARERLGENHPRYATSLMNLAGSRIWLGYPEEAEKLYREALQINLDYHGREHPTVASNLSLLGTALAELDREEEARGLMTEALEITEQVYGPDHNEVALVLNKLARLDMSQGLLDGAERGFRRELQIYRRTYGDEHVRTAAGWSNVASTQYRRKLYADSETSMRRAVETFAAALKPDHVDLAIARIKLGQLLVAREQYDEAIQQMNQGLEVMEAQTNPQNAWISAAKESIAEAREKM